MPANRLDYATPQPSTPTWSWPDVVALAHCAAVIVYIVLRFIRAVIAGIDC